MRVLILLTLVAPVACQSYGSYWNCTREYMTKQDDCYKNETIHVVRNYTECVQEHRGTDVCTQIFVKILDRQPLEKCDTKEERTAKCEHLHPDRREHKQKQEPQPESVVWKIVLFTICGVLSFFVAIFILGLSRLWADTMIELYGFAVKYWKRD
jgi:hypothetical protein